MGLLYPDHPQDDRPGLFDRDDRRREKRTSRSPDKRYSRRHNDRAARAPAQPVTTSTTSSGLRSLNDLMVRPPIKTRPSAASDRPRRRRDEERDAPRSERKERPRRERDERERSPRKSHQPQEQTAVQTDLDSPREERSPRKSDRPPRERRPSYHRSSRHASASSRRPRPDYADSRRQSSYTGRTKEEGTAPRPSPRRARFDDTPVTDTFPSTPAADTSMLDDASVATPTLKPAARVNASYVGGTEQQSEVATSVTSPSDLLPVTEATHHAKNALRSHENYEESNAYKPGPVTAESAVSSYLEGSNLEFGTPPARAYHRASSEDSQSDYFGRRGHRRDDSAWDEVEYYKYGQAPEEEPPRRRCCMSWSRKRKCLTITGIVASIIILIIVIAVAATLTNKFDYTPSTANVTNSEAFTSGGATHNSVDDVKDGIGAGKDEYTYYSGTAKNFPKSDKFVSFQNMWNANLDTLKHSCGWLKHGKNNTPKQIQDIFDAIQSRANASHVDHRVIFATILQESNGCVRAGATESSGGVRNPGLMQSHDGHAYDSHHSRLSILQMVQDGTQGTKHGDGIVQNLNLYGNVWKAARGYNSGYIPKNGNLSEAAGATACYVSDLANRLTGWVKAESKCHD